METSNTPQPNFRELFEDFEPEPSNAVWTGIEARLQPEVTSQKIAPWVWWSSAAAIVLLLITGAIMLSLNLSAPRSFTDQQSLPSEQVLPAPQPESTHSNLAMDSTKQDIQPETQPNLSAAKHLLGMAHQSAIVNPRNVPEYSI